MTHPASVGMEGSMALSSPSQCVILREDPLGRGPSGIE